MLIKRSLRQACAAVLVAVCCGMSVTGCAHQPTSADVRRIAEDPTLTDAQKIDRIRALAPDANAANYSLAEGMLAVGLVLLATGLTLKARKDRAGSRKARPNVAKFPSGKSKGSSTPAGISDVTPPSTPPDVTPLRVNPATMDEVPVVETNAVSPPPRVPANQAEVDAVPSDARGVSFFTSKPYPIDYLAEVNIHFEAGDRSVMCTWNEVEQMEAGKAPLVRAFSIGERTAPWYDWPEYRPFQNYWAAVEGEWQVNGKRAIACWLTLDVCEKHMDGYYAYLRWQDDDDAGVDDVIVVDGGEVDSDGDPPNDEVDANPDEGEESAAGDSDEAMVDESADPLPEGVNSARDAAAASADSPDENRHGRKNAVARALR